jgi:hypothetical protein
VEARISSQLRQGSLAQLAIGLFPHAHDQLNLKRHRQRAEAMLIALFTANNKAMP